MLPTSIARCLLMQDRMDWNRPHAAWLTRKFYALRFPSKHDGQPIWRSRG